MKERRALFLTVGMVCLLLVFLSYAGCRKTDSPFGVHAPQGLDVPSPTFTPVTGNLTVNVQDSGAAVDGVTVLAVEPGGNTLSATTANGSANFSYHYQPTSSEHLFLLKIPTQGNFWDSTASFDPADGNVFTFSSNSPSNPDSLDFTGQGTNNPSYPYSALPVSIPLTLTYNQPGNLSVPLLVYALGLPEGWGLSFPVSVLGEGISSMPVSLTVPSQSYEQPVLQFAGINSGGTTYVTSNSVTISRGYVVMVQASFNYSYNTSTCVFTGGFNYTVTPPINTLWQGSCSVSFVTLQRATTVSTEASSEAVSFIGAGLSTWEYQGALPTHITSITSISVSMTSLLGTYNFSKDNPDKSYFFPATNF